MAKRMNRSPGMPQSAALVGRFSNGDLDRSRQFWLRQSTAAALVVKQLQFPFAIPDGRAADFEYSHSRGLSFCWNLWILQLLTAGSSSSRIGRSEEHTSELQSL